MSAFLISSGAIKAGVLDMLEALVAVSLAGNVVQFVQFAGELISQTITIRKNGGPSSLSELKKLTESLRNQACVITTHLEAGAVNQVLAQEDQVSDKTIIPVLLLTCCSTCSR